MNTRSIVKSSDNKIVLQYITPGWLFINGATRVGTLIVATIYLQLIQNRYMFGSFTALVTST